MPLTRADKSNLLELDTNAFGKIYLKKPTAKDMFAAGKYPDSQEAAFFLCIVVDEQGNPDWELNNENIAEVEAFPPDWWNEVVTAAVEHGYWLKAAPTADDLAENPT